jgi:hypothetical protein
MTTKASVLSAPDAEPQPPGAERQDSGAKASSPTPMMTPDTVSWPIHAFGVGDGRTVSGRQRHAEKVAGAHDEHHQQWHQDRLTGHDKADGQGKHLHRLLDDRVQRVAQDAGRLCGPP